MGGRGAGDRVQEADRGPPGQPQVGGLGGESFVLVNSNLTRLLIGQ